MNPHVGAPAAVLWDMDGTLIDSEPYWIAAETELAALYGVDWSQDDGLTLVGNPLLLSAAVLRERGVLLPLETIVDRLIGRVTMQVRERVPWQSDAFELLGRVLTAGIPCALVTMSYRSLADAMLAQIPDGFAALVTGDEVTHGKPHPEPYLTAAARLGVSIFDCVAIEDSPAGVASALASGARTIGVRRLTPIEPAPGLSRVEGLGRLDIDAIARIAQGEVLDELGERV